MAELSVVDVALGVLFALVLVLLFGGLGAWSGGRAASREPSAGGRVACWANVVAWLFPPLGLFTSTYVLAMHKDSWTSRKAITGLASVCLLLSLLNSAIGARGGVETARDRAAARDGRSEPSAFDKVPLRQVESLGGPPPTQTPPTQTPPTQPGPGQDASSVGGRAKVVGSSELPEGFGAVAVDPRNKRVFVSSPVASSVGVLDFDGKLERTISGVPGAASLLVEGSKLYVAATTAGRIEVFDTASLKRTEVLGQGALVSPGPLAMAGGRLWTSTGSCGGFGTKLVAIDLSSKAVVEHPLDGRSSYCVGMATSPADPNVLLTFEPGLSPATITRLDVSAPVPSVVRPSGSRSSGT